MPIPTKDDLDKCKCSFAIRMTGDGCRYCQPDTYIDNLELTIQEMREEAAPTTKAEPAIDPIQAAADAASVGHLAHLLDHQSALLGAAMAAMKAVEQTASPIDESSGDLDARIPCEAWASFVDARAALLHDVSQSPVAAQASPANALDSLTLAELLEVRRASDDFEDCGETDVNDALLMRAANAGYLECVRYQVLNQSALDLDIDAAMAAQKNGGE